MKGIMILLMMITVNRLMNFDSTEDVLGPAGRSNLL
jgi:hypothetical protein